MRARLGIVALAGCLAPPALAQEPPADPRAGGRPGAGRARELDMERMVRRIRAAQARARRELEGFERVELGDDTPTEELVAVFEVCDSVTRVRAARILGARGPAAHGALPALVAALEARHPRTSDPATGEPVGATAVQRAVAAAVVAIAPDERAALAAHGWRLANGDELERRDAAMALGRQGAAAGRSVFPLMTAVRDDSALVAREAVTALGMLGAGATRAIPVLAELTFDRDGQLRERARAALRQITGQDPDRSRRRPERAIHLVGQVDEATVPIADGHDGFTVLEVLARNQPRTLGRLVVLRRQGAGLQALVVDARRMILTGNTTHNVRLGAGDVVFFPGGAEQPGRGDLVERALDAALPILDGEGKVRVWTYRLAHHAEPLARARAALTVGAFGDTAAFAVPQLLRALDQDEPVAREVVTALGMIGPAAAAAVPALEKLVDHRDAQIAKRAVAALRQIRATKR